jgi:polyphosphate kinase
VSPDTTRSGIRALIDGEVAAAREGLPASITLKMNSLVDVEMIDALYEASAAGVDVDLVVRGICCLVPGVEGLSDRIRVRSIVGRYLEHSRIYRFANGQAPGVPTILIGSADLMPRNLDRRVEALVPVLEPDLQARLEEILEINLEDDTLAWELGPDGTWRHVEGSREVDTHVRLQQVARTRARRLG